LHHVERAQILLTIEVAAIPILFRLIKPQQQALDVQPALFKDLGEDY